MAPPQLPPDISEVVERALAEDLGSGDLTAALIDADSRVAAEVCVREPSVLCGAAWFDEVFRQIDPSVSIEWTRADGEELDAETIVCRLSGHARAILTGERTALNFLQTLSGTATITRDFVRAVDGTTARILDTRKTLPGMRMAQKYAVRCGGGHNHRLGLFDAVLIKENHIAACGSLKEAVSAARALSPSVLVEVEVEDLDQVRDGLESEADRLLLDNFALEQIRAAVLLRDETGAAGKELEASGGIVLDDVRAVAETGVDWISVGKLTKDMKATDFSLRIV